MSPRLIVGVDCATDPRKVGLAIGHWRDGRLHLLGARAGSTTEENLALLTAWLDLDPDLPSLLALDAPLGWPAPMADHLPGHRAGQSIPVPPNQLFRRATDRFVHHHLGKLPLDVGADRIARTALAALQLLDDLRNRTGRPIPLAENAIPPTSTAAIEVYPAATLHARGLRSTAYKRPDQEPARREILSGLSSEWHLEVSGVDQAMLAQADVLDAAICVLAGADFAAGLALPPEDPDLARREGWIWVRPSDPEPGSEHRSAVLDASRRSQDPPSPEDPKSLAPLLIVDGANVVGSVPDGWWRDRAGAARRLRDALVEVARRGLSDHGFEALRLGPIEVILVVEGAARGLPSVPDVQVVSAPGSGDDRIVQLVADRDPGRWCVVATADRELIARVRALGSERIGPRSLPRR